MSEVDRRRLLTGAAAFAWLAAPALLRAQSREALRFGLTPVFLSNDLDLLAGLQAYLEQSTGEVVELVTRRTYQEVTALVVSGQLDGAWICGYPFVQYRADLELLAVPQWRGRPLYQAYLIAAARRFAKWLADLAGDIHAYSDPNSNSGYLVTQAELARQHLDAARFFRRTFFTYGHNNVIRAVSAGLAQSGSVDGYVWEVMAETEPDLVARTRVVWKSEWLGFPPVVASRSRVDPARRASLKRALLDMHADPLGARVLADLRFDRFAPPPAGLFDGIAANMRLVEGT